MPAVRRSPRSGADAVRVFYDHQVTSLQDAGGVSRYFFQLIQSLMQSGGVAPDLLLGLEHSVVPFRSLPRPARVTAIRGSLRPGYQRYAINEAITALAAPLRGKYDIYHATYQRLLPYVRHRAVVVTHHDSTPERYPQLFPDAAAIHARLSKLYAAADRIICISESSRRDLLQFHSIDPAKTEVIHHGFTPLPEAELLSTDFNGKPFLLYVGARSAYKNFPVVLEALAQQRDPSLCLLVLGGGAFTDSENSQIKRLELGGRIQLIPRATDAQLSAAYKSATLFIYPSLYEGFGFPPLEAMQAGCPAIVSRTSALPEICGDAAFYFDTENSEGLASLIESVRGDEAFRLSKRDAGFAQVRRYSWEKAAAETLAVYRKTVADKA
jgi:glycosyltransferase involved in cell wall biosynthesis